MCYLRNRISQGINNPSYHHFFQNRVWFQGLFISNPIMHECISDNLKKGPSLTTTIPNLLEHENIQFDKAKLTIKHHFFNGIKKHAWITCL